MRLFERIEYLASHLNSVSGFGDEKAVRVVFAARGYKNPPCKHIISKRDQFSSVRFCAADFTG